MASDEITIGCIFIQQLCTDAEKLERYAQQHRQYALDNRLKALETVEKLAEAIKAGSRSGDDFQDFAILVCARIQNIPNKFVDQYRVLDSKIKGNPGAEFLIAIRTERPMGHSCEPVGLHTGEMEVEYKLVGGFLSLGGLRVDFEKLRCELQAAKTVSCELKFPKMGHLWPGDVTIHDEPSVCPFPHLNAGGVMVCIGEEEIRSYIAGQDFPFLIKQRLYDKMFRDALHQGIG